VSEKNGEWFFGEVGGRVFNDVRRSVASCALLGSIFLSLGYAVSESVKKW
jgi:hypothetical protein